MSKVMNAFGPRSRGRRPFGEAREKTQGAGIGSERQRWGLKLGLDRSETGAVSQKDGGRNRSIHLGVEMGGLGKPK